MLSPSSLISCISLYRSCINYEQRALSPLPPFIRDDTFVPSETVAALFLISPQAWCSGVVHTHSCRDIYGHVWEAQDVPQGLRASCQLKQAGENTSHFGTHSHFTSHSICLCLFISLSLAHSLPLYYCVFILFSWLHPLPRCRLR